MQPRRRRLTERSLSNEKGQMAIFVALTFQVLFVFFAMVVNVGLIVHDKINLQNSVDLAAYYGAQRQAELLNEMAHINYQIRQDYKLMAWRMRVLGEFGRNAHPGSITSSRGSDVPNDSQLYTYADSSAICVAHPAWSEAPPDNTLCSTPNIFIPEIPTLTVIAPFNAFNFGFQSAIENLRNLFGAACTNQGQLNWYFAGVLFSGYKRAVATRRQMITQIAQNLSSSSTDFTDHHLASTRAGVLKTLKNNLTVSNLRGLPNDDAVVTLNSMALGPCSDPSHWLPDVPIRPYLMYTDNVRVNGCTAEPRPIFIPPTYRNIMPTLDRDGLLMDLTTNSDSVALSNPMHSSLGFEKNPWCVAYFGVRATTRPSKPFGPFGDSVTLEARSFAQPFGGRIGPWYGASWPQGAGQSTGERTDPLTPPRLPMASPPPPAELRAASMPNYSRFPGDPMGLKSRAALGAFRQATWSFFVAGNKVALRHYEDLKNVPITGDVLPWDSDNSRPPPVRALELAAVAPDLFDITYYSIDPDYSHLYFGASRETGRFTGGVKPISDIGTRFNPDAMMGNNVATQINTANSTSPPTYIDRALAYWVVRAPAHLLTGWTQKASADYGFPTERFGTCDPQGTPKPEAPATGGCVVGGRVGYSIRHVSRDYLMFEGQTVGGAGSAGAFENPPSLAGSGW